MPANGPTRQAIGEDDRGRYIATKSGYMRYSCGDPRTEQPFFLPSFLDSNLGRCPLRHWCKHLDALSDAMDPCQRAAHLHGSRSWSLLTNGCFVWATKGDLEPCFAAIAPASATDALV